VVIDVIEEPVPGVVAITEFEEVRIPMPSSDEETKDKVPTSLLRYACSYTLANRGHDTRALQAYFGHRNIQHTMRYRELSPTRLRTSGGSERYAENRRKPVPQSKDASSYGVAEMQTVSITMLQPKNGRAR